MNSATFAAHAILLTQPRMKHLFPLLGLGLLLGLSACSERGEDPTRAAEELSQSQRRNLLERMDQLLSEVWDAPEAVARQTQQLFPAGAHSLLVEDEELRSSWNYLRKAQLLSQRVRQIQAECRTTRYDRYQSMITLSGSYSKPSIEQVATDPSLLLFRRTQLEAELRAFLQQEAPSYKRRFPQREAALERAVQQRGLAVLDSTLATYPEFTGREAELEGSRWQQQGFRRGALIPGSYSSYEWLTTEPLGNSLSFGAGHALSLDYLQTPKIYGNFPYGYEAARIFDDYDSRGTGEGGSIYGRGEDWDSSRPQRYYFGARYLTLVLPMKRALASSFGPYTVVWTMRYQGEAYKAKQTLEPEYDTTKRTEAAADPYLYISIYDSERHYGTLLVGRSVQRDWHGPVRFLRTQAKAQR